MSLTTLTFNSWMHEMVYVSNGLETEKRMIAFFYIIRDVLTPFLKEHGFKLEFVNQEVNGIILQAIYATLKGKKLQLPTSDLHCLDIYQNEYYDRIDINEWDLFWERVGEYHDFNLDTTNYGYKIRAVFPVIVWSCISIELSSATQQVDEMYNDFEYDHEPDPMFHSREKVDSYILDQALNTEPYNRF